MEWLFIILTILISYVIIQLAIDRSLSAKLLKENLKVLIEIRELLEKQNKNNGQQQNHNHQQHQHKDSAASN